MKGFKLLTKIGRLITRRKPSQVSPQVDTYVEPYESFVEMAADFPALWKAPPSPSVCPPYPCGHSHGLPAPSKPEYVSDGF